MALRNTNTDFGALAKWLHWLVAVGIFWLIYLGLEQAGMERSPEKTAARATRASWAMLVIHIQASMYNHFVIKNDVLRRMTVGNMSRIEGTGH